MDMAKTTFSVRLELSQKSALEKLAIKEGLTTSSFISSILVDFLAGKNRTRSEHDPNTIRTRSEHVTESVPKSRKVKAHAAEDYKLPDLAGNPREQHPDYPTIWISQHEQLGVENFFTKRGLEREFFDDAYRFLDDWFSKNPKQHNDTKSHARALINWPLQRALEVQATTHKTRKVNPTTIRGTDRVLGLKKHLQKELYGNQGTDFKNYDVSGTGVSNHGNTCGKASNMGGTPAMLPGGSPKERSRLVSDNLRQSTPAEFSPIHSSNTGQQTAISRKSTSAPARISDMFGTRNSEENL